MKRIYLLLLLTCATIGSYAQVTGTKVIGVDYTNLAAAVTALNTSGISGAVVINVPAGWTETAPSGGYVLGSSTLNASTSSTNTLTIQKSGSGANPLLTAPVGTTTTNDGIFIIQGADYVTINRIDLVDTNTVSSTEKMEWGYALVKRQSSSPFDGCQYVSIQNSAITLSQTNTASVGIYGGNHTASSTTNLSISSATDAMNNCSFLGNTITNVNRGVSLTGHTTASSPYSAYDQNNTVGGSGSNLGNTISNFGGTSTSGYGVYVAAQNNCVVRFNTITSATTPGTGGIYGVFHGVGNNSSFTASNNTIQLTLGSSGIMYGIANGTSAANSGVNGTTASITISGNTFQNYSFTASNASVQYPCVYNVGGSTSGWDCGSVKILGNTATNMALNATSTHYMFYNYYCNSNDVRFMDNKVSNVRRTGTAGNTYFFYNMYGNPTGGADSMCRNRISNCSAPYSFYGFYNYLSGNTARNHVMQYDTVMNDTCALGSTYYYLYGIYAYYGNNQTITNNYVAGIYGNPTNYGGAYGYYIGYGNNHIVQNNTLRDLTLGYYFYGMYTYGSAVSAQVNNNLIENVNWPSTGTTAYAYCYYPYTSGTMNHYNNTLRNITSSTTGTYIYGIYNVGGVTMNFYNDSIYNLTNNGTSTYYIYGYYQSGGTTSNIYNNYFHKYNVAGTAGNAYGAYFASASTINMYGNLVDSITVSNSSNTSGMAYGIQQASGTICNFNRNKISYVMANGTSGSAFGLYVNAGAHTIHNNIIGNIQLPNSSSTTGINLVGLYLGNSNTTGYNVSFNTVDLNATSTGSSFSSSAVYWSAASSGYPMTMKNNIFINTSQQSGTSMVSAMRWNTSSTSYYNNFGSNNNLLYAGTPGTYRHILYAGSGYQTLANFKTYVSPADGYSVTENTTFQSLTGVGTNFLRPSTTVPTQIESNGVNLTGLSQDHYFTIRAGNSGYTGSGVAPDLGAIEDNYTPNDINAPIIGGSPLPFSCGTGDRTFTATITDITGVPTSGSNVPRVYFKKGAGGTWYSNAGTLSTGTGTSGTWSFTITSATMGGLSLGDVVYYFVIAQDLASTPNIGSAPAGAVATGVSSISTYPTGLNYAIAGSLSGTYTVGSSGAYATLTAAAAAYNSSCISGPIVFSLISSTYPSETFPITFNANAYASSTNTLTIKPASGVTASISGSAVSSAIIKFNGADYITIDGSNTTGGTTKDLTLTNTYTSTNAVIWNGAIGGANNGADYNTVKNVNIVGGTNTTTSYPVYVGAASGITTQGDDNKNFTLQNCKISKGYYGVYLNGTPAFPATNALITQDSIGGSSTGDYIYLYSIYLMNQTNATISDNKIHSMKYNPSTNVAAIEIGQNNTGLQILRNEIKGIWNESTGGWGAWGIDISNSGNSNILIANNMISDIHTMNYTTVTPYYAPFGIRLFTLATNVKIYHNTINIDGNVTVGSSPMMSSCILYYTNYPGLEIVNNILHNRQTNTVSGSANYSIYTYLTGCTFSVIDYNDYSGVSTSTNSYKVGSNGTATVLTTKSDWTTFTGQDSHSIDTLPTFISTTNNRLQSIVSNGPFTFGTPISSVTTDYDGTARSTTSPRIGAHEVQIPPTLTADSPSLTFGPTTISTCSPAQTFTVNGSFLTPGGTLTLTATPSNYQVSLNGTTWTSSVTVTYSGTSSNQVVYVRFCPSATGAYTGNVAITGGGLASPTNVPLNGTGATACTGTPTPGTASIAPGIGGPTTPFTLNLTGTTVTGGLTYQWQSSTSGAGGSFSNIPGATTSTYNFTGIGGNMWYQAIVTCPTYAAATSNTVAATFSMAATYTGVIGTYVVPAGVTAIRIIARGAQGGAMTQSYPMAGGQGAIMQGDFCVTPGQVLKYLVGQMPAPVQYCGGGGGGSFVWDSATSTPLIVGGAGGGSGYYGGGTGGQGQNASTDISGTNANGLTGGYGIGGYGATTPTSIPSSVYGSGGAGWYSNGVSTNYTGCTPASTGGYTPLSGGAGGSYSYNITVCGPGGFGGGGGGQGYCSYLGAGGGGGYSGGAAGCYSSAGYAYGGGGGGSFNSGINQINSVGNTGHGSIVFTTPATASGSASVTSLTFGVTTIGSSSAVQTYTISASGLVSGGTLSITPTAGFELSLNGTTWCTSSSPCTYTYTAACLNALTIYVRSTPTAVGAYTGTATVTGGNLGTPIVVNLNGTGANICSGTPTAGTAAVAPTTGNTTTPFTLTVTGTTVAGGLTYQWQSGSSATGPWTNMAGATNPTFNFTGISATTYFRCRVTCSASGSTDSTTAVPATFFPNSGCTPTFLYASNSCSSYNMTGRINTLTGFGSTVLADATTCNGTGWEDYTTTTSLLGLQLQEGNSYTANVQTGSSYNVSTQIWIDFNNNGTFVSSETVGGITSFITSGTATVTIPFGVTPGTFRMRIVTNYNPGVVTYEGIYPSINPCPDNTIYYGDVRDYKVTIVPLPPCSGTPTPGTVSSTVTSGCAPLASALTVSGSSTGVSALTYQWQASPDGTSSWSDVSGATNMAFSPTVSATTYYRRAITCTLSSSTAFTPSSVMTVSLSPTPIQGPTNVCLGQTITLTDSVAGGTWLSNASGTASVTSTTGIVTGVSAGAATITYKLTSTGCQMTQVVGVNTVVPTVSVNASPSTICAGESFTMTATPTNTLPGYAMSSVPYSFITPVSPTTASFTSIDDGYATATIPFSFNFFGTNYTTAYIGTNGYITFGTAYSGLGTYALPTASAPYAMISYAMGDLYVGGSPGTVTYATNGTSPNRIFVVTFDQIGNCCSAADVYDAQIRLYETSNTVEVMISKSSGTRTIGIQNTGGSVGYAPSGRNGVNYTITPSAPEGYRWVVPQAEYAWSPATSLTATTGLVVTANAITTTPVVTYSVSRTFNGCGTTAVATVTVNPLPNAITGTPVVCEGLTTSLSTASVGGTWQSSTGSVATVGGTTGVVAGVTAGTTNVSYTYTSTGCRTTQVISVNPVPAPITGTASACVGASTSLATTSTGGTWSSGTPSVATVTSSGVSSGLLAGVANITYMYPTGCLAQKQVTVNPIPVINVTPVTAPTICQGESTSFTATSPALEFSLLNQDFEAGLGLWTINTTIAPDSISKWNLVTPSTSGLIGIGFMATGDGDGSHWVEAAPSAGSGTSNMQSTVTSPSFSTVGFGSANLTFNEYLISLSSADLNVEVQYSINGGSTWTTILDQMDDVYTPDPWSLASPEISVALPSGALNEPNVKLRWNYYTNYGVGWAIDNVAVKAALPAATFTWAGVSGATGLSCSSCPSPTVTPTAAGANVYNVTANSTCSSNTNVTINVNPLPGVIGGTGATLCVGNSISLTNPSAGGTWTSSNTTIASVDPATGVLTGNTAGTATISYMLPSTCARTVIVTVNGAPSSITGTLGVCEGGATTTLGHAISGGTWYSNDALLATINPTSGVATGVNAGTLMITYTLPSGCKTWSPLSVNPTPVAFTGSSVVCEASTSTLASASTGGTWTSLGTSYATVDAASGVVTGVAAGTASIIYTLPTGCQRATVATVNVSPAALTGTPVVCEGMTTALSSPTTGGAWSSSAPLVASVSTSGVVSGDAAGNADISYTMGNGCYRTANVLVNPKPDVFTGTLAVCEGATTTLSSTPGGTWSGTTTNASVAATTGVVSGLVQGISPVTYTLSTGCARTANVSVNQSPAAITGSWAVCELATTLLNDATPGGTWSSDAASTASVDAGGNVTGGTAGNTNIYYTLSNGCKATALMTVNVLPDPITGTPSVCEGMTTALGSTTPGGTWSSSTSAIAGVGATTGIVSGVFAGISTVAYTISNGCYRSVDVVVNPLPAPISGVLQVCEGLITNLTDATPGGTWGIDATSVATISSGGAVNGNNAGTTNVTYTLSSTGCRTTAPVVVNPLPANITGTPVVCQGQTTLFSNTTAGGSWSTGAPAIAGVNTAGLVNGVTAGIASITYSLPTGCLKELPVIVNVTPSAIAGSGSVCEGAVSVQSTSPAGGVWNSSTPGVATVDASGNVTGVTAGAIVLSYTMSGTMCMTTKTMVVNPLPAPIGGVMTVCQGAVTVLNDATSGGTWSALSSGATADATTGAITGVLTGIAPVAYTLPTGCSVVANVNVNATPDAITGALTVCEGATTGLATTTTGGTWTSGATLNATIDASGVVSGVVNGIVPISYSVSTGCAAVAMVTVNAVPDVIGGVPAVCVGSTTNLTNTSLGGVWTSSNIAAGTVDPSTGIVTGVGSGTTNVVYTIGSGCSAATNVVVNPAPAPVVGATSVCAGSTTAMTDATLGGTWSTSSSNATVDMATGVVSGVTAGTADITYTIATGCASIAPMIVNPLPADIDGLPQVCQGSTTALADITPMGTWSSSNTAVATVDAMGMVSGVVTGAGTASAANIIYTLGTGCAKSVNVVVDPLPATIGGPATVCEGTTTGLTNATAGGAWSSSAYGTAYVDITTGDLTGVSAGAATVTYALTTGCLVTKSIVVNPLPAAITGTPAVCEGATTALSCTTTGGTWSSGAPATAGVAGGVVSGLVAGTATVAYTISTGCARTVDVLVKPAPTVYAVTGGGAYCAGTTGAVVGIASSDASALYQLYGGSTSIGSPVPGVGGALSFGPQAVGTYSVMATDPVTGCSIGMAGVVSTVITSTVTPTVSLATGSGSTTICAGTMTTFTATPVNGGSLPSYDWTVNGMSVASGTSATFSYIPVNGDVVNVTLNSSATCASPLTAGSSAIMTVNPLEMPIATIALPAGVSTICDGSPVTITATPTFGGPTPIYAWFVGTTPVTGVTGSTYTYVPSSGDLVHCTMVSSFGCVATPVVNSNTLTMITAPVFVPVVSIAVSPGTSVPAGTSVTFTAVTSGTGPTPSYQWYVNGAMVAGATGVNYTTSALSGSDSVSCKVTGSEPCGYESFNSVIMRIKPLGVNQVAGVSDIILVPNPNKGDFMVKGTLASKTNEEVTIEVTNVLGQTVYTGKLTAKNGSVNQRVQLSNSLANGMYMLNLRTDSETQVFHFVLEQ